MQMRGKKNNLQIKKKYGFYNIIFKHILINMFSYNKVFLMCHSKRV